MVHCGSEVVNPVAECSAECADGNLAKRATEPERDLHGPAPVLLGARLVGGLGLERGAQPFQLNLG